MIDFSALKNIDLANSDNLLFLLFVFIIVVVIIFILFFILSETIKIIKKIIIKVFNIDAKKPKFGQKENTDWFSGQFYNRKVTAKPARQSIVGGDFIKTSKTDKKEEEKQEYKQKYEAKEQKDIAEGLSKLKTDDSADKDTLESKMPSRSENHEDDNHQEIKITRVEHFEGSGAALSAEKNKSKESDKNSKQKYEAKEQKDIAEGLSKLKTDDSADKDTLESKMPSRSENHEDDNHQEIKIPTPKRFSTGNISPETEGINTSTKNAPQSASGFKKTAVTTNIGIIKPKGSAVMPEKNAVGSVAMNRADKKLGSTESSSVQDSSVLQKPDFIDDKLGAHSTHQAKELSKKIKQDKNEDQSIFKGESEVSRIKLRHEMKLDPKVWQASRQVGLNLSPVERAKLVKEVFSPVLGSNISKTDLKLSIKKLNQKMLGTQDSAEHAKIRKEIKFFKKIGGIK